MPQILLKPITDPKTKIWIHIYDQRGVLIKKLIPNQSYASIDRTIIWDTRDGRGRLVRAGLYHVVYFNGQKKEMRRIMIMR